ncbi:hypothetical protein GC176_18395 [bacterium]|nr:hypothetical protein [bacterium]
MAHDIEQLTHQALDAFWEVVVSRFVQPVSGDASPERALALSIAAEEAIAEWITLNTKVDHRRLRRSVIHDLLSLAKTCCSAFQERLDLLREERSAMQQYTEDLDDIDDQIGHYEALRRQCEITITKATGRRVRS